jgi:hypothetical protein
MDALHYHQPNTPPIGPSMPRLRSPLVILWLLAGLALPPALAQPAGQPALPIAGALASRPDTPPSGLDAELFYQLLIAELQRRHDPGAAYSIILEAARRTGHPELFRRAMEIALQGRAPQAALSAVREWRQRLPADDEARRTELQLLLGLQRVREAGPVLRDWIRATPGAATPCADCRDPLAAGARVGQNRGGGRCPNRTRAVFARAPDLGSGVGRARARASPSRRR